MQPHYRHTQIGWAIIGSFALIAAFVLPQLQAGHVDRGPALFLSIAGLVLLLFGALTVEVDASSIQLRFGVGLVRKRIALRGVKSWREVRNPWYSGWGIRMGPGGVMWNVSGFDAVELELDDGTRFRIGTDEPVALAAAIALARGEAPVGPSALSEGRPVVPRVAVAGRGSLALALLAGAALVGGLFWSQIQPPRVTVGPQGFEIGTLFYGDAFAAADITAISLERALPRVLVRTSGFAGAGTLRGRFRVEGLGDVRLFVDVGFAPYLKVRLQRDVVFINFRQPERTRALYEEMAQLWPTRVLAPAP
jgi:hypothetical protein